MTDARVTMIGSFPPPVHGAANFNEKISNALVAAGVDVIRVNTSGPTLSHSRSFLYHPQRSLRNLAGMARARAVGTADATLYIVPDAGLGAWYTRAHMTGAATRYGAVVIYHHSCRYVEQYNPAIAAITRIARQRATHVFLTDGMAAGFQRRYGEVNFRVVTNAHLVAEEAERPAVRRPSGPIRIGHLSNLCADKGFFAVVDAYEIIRSAGVDATLTLAGPIVEQEVNDRLANLREKHCGSAVTHVGPLSGDRKIDFYRGIDVFFFPTAFKQEAAPAVVYEALAAGCPVLATDRGVIPEIIPTLGGVVCGRDEDFSASALNYIRAQEWSEEARGFRADQIKNWIRGEAVNSNAQRHRVMTQLATKPRMSSNGRPAVAGTSALSQSISQTKRGHMYVDQTELERAAARVVERFPFPGYFDPVLNGQMTVAETVARYLPLGSRVLDLGAGAADKTALVASIGYKCTAIDDLQDPWHKRGRAREMILDFAKEMNVDYIASTGELPTFTEKFDMVMLHHVLEHLHDSPRHLLIDLLERVRDGGYLFITVPNHVNLRKRIAVLRGKTSLPSFQLYYWNPGPWRGHIREYTRGDCIALAEALELDVVEIRGVHNMLERVPSPLRRLYLSLSRLAPSTRDTWSMVARKPAGWAPKRELDEVGLRQAGLKFWTNVGS